MKENRATLEVIAPTVEEAIAKGLSDLGLPEDAVEVEVLDQGSRGLFGLGSRQARVRLVVKSGRLIEQPEQTTEELEEPPSDVEEAEDELEEEVESIDFEEDVLWPETASAPA